MQTTVNGRIEFQTMPENAFSSLNATYLWICNRYIGLYELQKRYPEFTGLELFSSYLFYELCFHLPCWQLLKIGEVLQTMSIEKQLLLRSIQCLLCLQRQKPYLDYQHHGRHIVEPIKAYLMFYVHYQKWW